MRYRLKRTIRATDDLRAPKRSSSVIVEESHARQILNLPGTQRKIVIKAIQEGTSVSSISKYFSEQGWLKVAENTFTQYLIAFKRVYPELCEGNDTSTLDHLVDGKRPNLDEEVELERLYRMQKIRLKVGLEFEQNTSFLNKDLHKDVLAGKDLLESLATLRGKRTGAGRPTGANSSVPLTNEAAESLRKVDNGEAAQVRMVTAMSELIGLVNAKGSAKVKE